jgi:hypothetical protein
VLAGRADDGGGFGHAWCVSETRLSASGEGEVP